MEAAWVASKLCYHLLIIYYFSCLLPFTIKSLGRYQMYYANHNNLAPKFLKICRCPLKIKLVIWLLGILFGMSAFAKGVLLEDLTWVEAEKKLTPETIIVIPLGAAAKEHGPHLKLKNDFLIAEYLKKKVLEKENVVIAPTVNYGFYPAFTEYPGTTHLRFETFRDMMVDICRGLSRFGPRRFYALNTGISTLHPLREASQILSRENIILEFTNLSEILGPVEKKISHQEGGSHADEIETSMMMVIAPATVDMKKAAKDFHQGEGPLTRNPKNTKGTYSPTGIWGDATLASKTKGKVAVGALVQGVLNDIRRLKSKPCLK
jgi:creatinine amidohydrolase